MTPPEQKDPETRAKVRRQLSTPAATTFFTALDEAGEASALALDTARTLYDKLRHRAEPDGMVEEIRVLLAEVYGAQIPRTQCERIAEILVGDTSRLAAAALNRRHE